MKEKVAMPFVTGLGIPAGLLGSELENLEYDIKAAVCGVNELGLQGKEDEVIVILIPGLNYTGQNLNILVETSGLRNEPERTPTVRKFVASTVGRAFDKHFPDAFVASRVGEPYDYTAMPYWDNAK